MDKLNQKFALVTGGSRGIGKAICLDLVKQGFNVAFTYFRNSNIAKKTLTELKKEKKKCFSIKTHLGKEKDIEILFEKINNKFGKLDVLVNNAATGINVKSEELSPKHWDWVMNTNIRHFFDFSTIKTYNTNSNELKKLCHIQCINKVL